MSQPFVNAHDRAYIERVGDAQLRDTITNSLTQYRRADQLEVGDPLPSLTLTQLADGANVSLDELNAGKPLVLIFGSYT